MWRYLVRRNPQVIVQWNLEGRMCGTVAFTIKWDDYAVWSSTRYSTLQKGREGKREPEGVSKRVRPSSDLLPKCLHGLCLVNEARNLKFNPYLPMWVAAMPGPPWSVLAGSWNQGWEKRKENGRRHSGRKRRRGKQDGEDHYSFRIVCVSYMESVLFVCHMNMRTYKNCVAEIMYLLWL